MHAFPWFQSITGYNSKSQKTGNLSKSSICLKKRGKKKRLEPSGGQKYGDSQKVSGCGRNEAGSGGGE